MGRLGIGLALLTSGFLTWLYGVKAFDPRLLLAAAGVQIAAALLASGMPARRATRINTSVSLRAE